MMDELQGLMLSIIFLGMLVIGSIAIMYIVSILFVLLKKLTRWLDGGRSERE